MIIILPESAIKLTGLQVNDSLLSIKSGGNISIVSVLIIAPHFKMQMRKCRIAGVATKANQPAACYSIPHLH